MSRRTAFVSGFKKSDLECARFDSILIEGDRSMGVEEIRRVRYERRRVDRGKIERGDGFLGNPVLAIDVGGVMLQADVSISRAEEETWRLASEWPQRI